MIYNIKGSTEVYKQYPYYITKIALLCLTGGNKHVDCFQAYFWHGIASCDVGTFVYVQAYCAWDTGRQVKLRLGLSFQELA